MSTHKRITVQLVADHAGVSIASVSRVLNGLAASDEVVAKVNQAVAELGYVPSATARSLKAGKTDQIAFAVADVGNPVYVAMMHEVSQVIAHSGYRLVLSSTGNEAEAQLDVLDSLNRGFADGLLLSPLRVTPELVERLQTSRLPIVIIGSLPEGVELDNVRADSPVGVGLAVDHLVEQGRKRIAFVNGPVDTVPGAARLSGYVNAMTKHGLPLQAEMQVNAADFTYKDGLVAVNALLDQATPDAIICANDLLAVAALKAMTLRGLSVPNDVALVGMDDTDVAELAIPSITSVNLGSRTRAEAAAEMLLRRIDEPNAPAESVVIAPTLTIRESSVMQRETASVGDNK
ncbi:substrate-binding domain-containing protein [Lysinibacter cavernae]|uniref:LacI family transcriptional regulator n=1 Tax=Lysinibacter cavernae TaxID=1640652 RepID=A0A7X5R322_9MICO|nr:LacI family transcriptional regulator [Lysinibacter cavernae]